MSVEQAHLDGTTTAIEEFERTRPGTYLWDPKRGEWRLRISVPYVERDRCLTVAEYVEEHTDDEPTWGGGEFTAEDTAGHYYDVTISRTVEYRFTVPAYEEYQAKDIAEEWMLDASPADAHSVHTNVREGSSIQFEDTPEDYDPYSGERLVDALDRVGEEEDESE